jgi:hypothetical protein
MGSSCKHAYDPFDSMKEFSWVAERVLAFQKHFTARAMRFESFESDGSRWLCKNINGRIQIIIYEHLGKKNNNLFFTLWYRGVISLAEM